MGKAFSGLVRRPLKNWNVETRAEKVIERIEKGGGESAPLHPSTHHQVEQFRQEYPEYLEAQKTRHEGLHDRLKGLVVNPERVQEITSALKPLPMDRRAVQDFDYGYPESQVVPAGQCSLRQFLEILGRHQIDPEEDSAVVLAAEYGLDEEKLTQALKHFHIYEVQIPKDKKEFLGDGPDAKPLASGLKMKLLGRKKEERSDNPETAGSTKS